MARFAAGRGVPAFVALLVLLTAPRSEAFEAFDGRLQAHGFVETQVRAIDSSFTQELDLTQWYNVLNVELETDILPDGWGPIDLLQTYVRGEVRYDCVWQHACGMFRSVNTYGDQTQRLPRRLRDAKDREWAGVIPLGQQVKLADGKVRGGTVLRIQNKEVFRIRPRAENIINPDFNPNIQAAFPVQPGTGLPLDYSVQNSRSAIQILERQGFPGFDTLFGQEGGDDILGTIDDPANATFDGTAGLRFTAQEFRGPGGGGGTTRLLGPWRPKDFITETALLHQVASPFRGRTTATGNTRYHTRDSPAAIASNMGVVPDMFPSALNFFFDHPLNKNGDSVFPFTAQANDTTGLIEPAFGGDFSSIVPCRTPDWEATSTAGTLSNQQSQFIGVTEVRTCIPRSMRNAAEFALGIRYDGPANTPGIDHPNIRVIGGRGETPLRPAPDRGNSSPHFDKVTAQGLFIPSRGYIDYYQRNDLDSHPFNIRQARREWNRGDSQEDEKEFKEGYIDAEFLDSRLWARIGKQNIVWGKTELFRTTDQFNPQDLALATLPGLEESRIALWAARFVYSLYDVGPLEDVRLEFAMNFDQFEPNDLGACGEPYAFDVICTLTSGIWAHSVLGIGVAGFDRPPNPWDSTKGIEVGGRIEWRWDRFSFAVSDFYGYDDFPYPERIMTFGRNVDPSTGRPLIYGARSGCTGLIEGATLNANGTMNLAGVDPTTVSYTSANFDPKDYASVSVAGIGRDPGCLKPGGAAKGVNESSGLVENGFGLGVDSSGNPLFYVMNAKGAIITDTSGPDAGLFQNPLVCNPGTFVPPVGSGQACLPARALNAKRRQFLTPGIIDVAPGGIPGASPQNALENHHANQQIFAWICSTTVSIAAGIDPQACAWTVFASPQPLTEVTQTPALAEFLVGVYAGEPQGSDGGPNILRQIAGAVRTATANLGPAEVGGLGMRLVTPLNRDPNDGVITVLSQSINRLNPTRPNPFGVAYFQQDQIDFLTLDSTMTNEQRALLGCGPFYGTRCDSSARATASQQGVSQFFNGIGVIEGGGIDFLGMEGSVLVNSLVGTDGTDLEDGFYRKGGATAVFHPFLRGAPVYSATTLPSRQIVDTTGNGVPDTVMNCLLAVPTPCTPGFDYTGTEDLTAYRRTGMWTSTSTLPQPGTIGFRKYGGPVCTRAAGGGSLLLLPGCRGAVDIAGRDTAFVTGQIEVTYDYNYNPNIDGCTFAPVLRPINPGTGMRQSINVTGVYPDGTPVDLSPCSSSTSRRSWTAVAGTLGQSVVNQTAGTLYHPHAACQANKWPNTPAGQAQAQADAVAGVLCDSRTRFAHFVVTQADLNDGGGLTVITDFQLAPVATQGRDFDTQFFRNVRTLPDGSPTYGAQVFYNEAAAFSWNFMQFLIAAACNETSDDIANDPECFDDRFPFKSGKCSFNTPQFCGNVKAFFAVAGVQRNVVRAGGNGRFGRRTFLWHGGGEVVLKYEKRNVLGFSMDFAEDVTKSNWGVEFTWIEDVPFFDNDEFDNVRNANTLNLTVSVDRPTFVNFLNPNRTFFINSQWFFQYIPDYKSGFTANGPFNVLFTVAAFTGYFQDRLLPTMVTVYDFRSRSGGLLPSLTYRFNEAFSTTIGMSIFFGHTQLEDMAVNPIAPPANRAAKNAYKDGNDQFISNVRQRDEVFFRLRYTF